MPSTDITRRTGYFAILAGIIGLVAVGLLIAALAAPTPSPDTMRRETNFFLWQDAGVILQALAMIPLTLGIYQLSVEPGGNRHRNTLALGLLAQAGLVLTSGLIFTGTASDMLYMAPMGLVGLWLLLVCRNRDGLMSSRLAWLGRVAGFGLILIGLGFLIYGILVAPAIFVRPLTSAEIDAQTLTPANLVSHLLLAAGTLLGRVIYPLWAILLGRSLLRMRAIPEPVAAVTA
jgi:hypothetical protein